MNGRHYILGDDGEPIPVDLMTWAAWFEEDRNFRRLRQICRTETPRGVVSTVFVGMDLSIGDETPLLFETMFFASDSKNDEHHEATDRYPDLDSAIAGHIYFVHRYLS